MKLDYLYCKINFYYILFKYILKNKIFIYPFPLLTKTKKIIIELIKSKNIKKSKNSNKEIELKYKYVLETFADSKYFFEYREKKGLIELETILKYYKSFYFEPRVKDIKKIEQDIKNKGVDSECLKDYQKAVERNNIYSIIKILYFIFYIKK